MIDVILDLVDPSALIVVIVVIAAWSHHVGQRAGTSSGIHANWLTCVLTPTGIAWFVANLAICTPSIYFLTHALARANVLRTWGATTIVGSSSFHQIVLLVVALGFAATLQILTFAIGAERGRRRAQRTMANKAPQGKRDDAVR